MRRKLIKQEAFEQIARSSVTAAERELVEAEDVLARALGKDHLSLHSFTDSVVMYETLDDTYVHAGYRVGDRDVQFTNIEELVIDHESHVSRRKSVISEMIDAIIKDENETATRLFNEYMSLYSFNEAKKTVVREKGGKFTSKDVDDKEKPKGKLPKKLSPFVKDKAKKSRDKKNEFKDSAKGRNLEEKGDGFKKMLRAAGKKVEESYQVAVNVLEYVTQRRFGPVLAESSMQQDDRGNVVNLRVPTSRMRNESRLVASNWRTLNSQVHQLREGAKSLSSDENFARAMSDLRRENAKSDVHGMQTVLENVVRAFPQVLYVTQGELSTMVGEALEFAGARNYDDKVCDFLAEAVLSSAMGAFQERVNQIMHLASAGKPADGVDAYDHFQTVAENFYAQVDQKFEIERKVFEDLYESLKQWYDVAQRRDDTNLRRATASYLNELADVLNNKVRADLDLAEEAAEFLADVVETNLSGSEWKVSNSYHSSLSGDHPDMEEKARKGYTPSEDAEGDYGDPAPQIGSDDMNYKGGKYAKEGRSKGLGNEAGADIYPKIKNPNVLKPFGDYTMKGEKGVDKEATGQHGATWKSVDTYPSLQNPNVPKAENPYTYKMNHGKDRDLVVDK